MCTQKYKDPHDVLHYIINTFNSIQHYTAELIKSSIPSQKALTLFIVNSQSAKELLE